MTESERLLLILSEAGDSFRWCIRQADGDWMRFVCVATMFLRHPGASVAENN